MAMLSKWHNGTLAERKEFLRTARSQLLVEHGMKTFQLAQTLYPDLPGLEDVVLVLAIAADSGLETMLDALHETYGYTQLIQQWLAIPDLAASQEFLHAHPELVTDPLTLEFLTEQDDDPQLLQRIGIIRLARTLPLADVYDIASDVSMAVDAAMTATESGELEILEGLWLAAPDLSSAAFAGAFLASVIVVLRSRVSNGYPRDTITATLMTAAAAQGNVTQRTAGAARLRRLAHRTPEHAGPLAHLADVLVQDTVRAGQLPQAAISNLINQIRRTGTLATAAERLRCYREAASTDPLVHILTQICVDWVRCGAPGAIPEADLLELARHALEESHPDLNLQENELEDALHRACNPIPGGNQVALLTVSLLTSQKRGYETFDCIVAADKGHGRHRARPLTDATWRRFLDHATVEDAFNMGFAAWQSGNLAVAVTATRRAAIAGHTRAQSNLGVLLADIVDPPELIEARTWLTRAAQDGDTEAQFKLGALLGVQLEPLEIDEARSWYTKAAEAGHIQAQHNLGVVLTTLVDPPELDEARTWWTSAAQAGDISAQYNLGVLLGTLIDPPELDEARAWYTKAAQAGHIDAQSNLGYLLSKRLEPSELVEGRKWYIMAAEAGNTNAQLNLGMLFAAEVDPPQMAEARAWLTKAAEGGNITAQIGLAKLLAFWLDPPELTEARMWLTRAAEAGNIEAQSTLGSLLLSIEPDSPELAEARMWLTSAAEAGDIAAQFGLGVLLAYQLDPPEKTEARIWLTKAAEAGIADIQNYLGALLAGLDPPELAEARMWWTRAAETGSAEAQYNLGQLLVHLVDPPELAEARIWFTRAAAAGNADAQAQLDHLPTAEPGSSTQLKPGEA